jgi:arylsulfatase A-like enzyme
MWRVLSQARWPYLVLGLLMILAWAASHVELRSDSRPEGTWQDLARLREREDVNVLFVLVDTLRAHRLGSQGYERDTSPHLDALADSGIRFAHNVSQSSWTKCSMASLWTGLYPARTGVLRLEHAVAPGARMPAEIFQEAGFRTAGIWRNGWVAPNFGFGQGFEIYHRPRPGRVPLSVRRENPSIKLEGTDQDVIQSALEFIRSHQSGRWFLYVHLMDVHQYVYDEETALFGNRYSDMYDNAIRWTDRLIGVLLGGLERHGLRERTLIVFASDHGEAFGEHGLEGHARNVYGEVTDTPFILSLRFRLDTGIVVESRSANVDVWPTVLDLLGLEISAGLDGRSRLPEIEAAAQGADRGEADGPIFAQIDQTWGQARRAPEPMVAVTDGAYRLVHRVAAPQRDELYDRSRDPREQRDLAAELPDVASRLRAEAETYLASPPPPWGTAAPRVEIDDMEINQLRALGYAIP